MVLSTVTAPVEVMNAWYASMPMPLNSAANEPSMVMGRSIMKAFMMTWMIQFWAILPEIAVSFSMS